MLTTLYGGIGQQCHVVTLLDDYYRILLITYGICRRCPTSFSILALLTRAISLNGVYLMPQVLEI